MSERDLSTSRAQVFGTVPKGTECRICGRDVDDGRAVYCSDWCRSIANGVMSLLNWGGVRRLVLERDDETCKVCGKKQAWLDRGYDHLRSMVEAELPEQPEGPSVLALGSGDISEDEQREYVDAFNEWCEQKRQLIRRIFREPEWPYTSCPTPPSPFEVDHITPLSEGGHPFDPANLWTLCVDCHKEKTAREASERAESRRLERPSVERVLFDFVADGGES